MAALVPDTFDADDMPPEARAAFLVYLATSGPRAGQRSYVQTAELIVRSIGTVKSWGARYRWGPRSKAIDRERSVQTLEAALEATAAQRLQNVEFLIKLRDNEVAPWSERRRSAETLLAMGGMANVAPATVPDDGEADAGAIDPAELQRLVAAGDIPTLLRLARGERIDGLADRAAVGAESGVPTPA